MPKFFVPAENIQGEEVIITGEDAHHLGAVLRMQVGDAIKVSIPGKERFLVSISQIDSHKVVGKIIQRQSISQEPPIRLRLFQGLAKGEKMDWVVQKAVELGAQEVIPFTSRYCVVKLDEKKQEKKIQRLQRIAHEAAKQSQRDNLPVVQRVLKFSELLGDITSRPDHLVLVPYELEEAQGLSSLVAQDVREISIIIGPEGGFAIEEITELTKVGGIPITLGPRILRTETAGIVALSLVGYRFGDLG